MFIRTERLFLRPAWPEDCQDLHAAIADERVVRNLTRAPWPYTADDARDFVVRSQDRRHPHFLITLPGASGARVIGGIGLNPDKAGAELGYWITPDAWGRGYATEAARAVLRVARSLGHEHVIALPFLDNPASARVLEKVGLQRTDQVVEQFSLGRGGSSTARAYALRLGPPCDCDRDPPQALEPEGAMRAA